MTIRVCVLAIVLTGMASTVAAQTKEPMPWFVADARGIILNLPTEEGWTPTVPTGTAVPGRTIGFELGAHVYVVRFRRLAIGIGATGLAGKGKTTPPEPVTTPTIQLPDVTTRLRALVPQLSLNFGHRLGWSYLSAGLGRTRVESEVSPASTASPPRDSDWTKTINYGGGARWFVNDHVGVGFDVRWHKISIVPPTATSPGAPRASLLVVGVGVSIK